MAGKPQAEKAVERFPELGCFAVAVRRIVYEKGMTLDNAIKKSGISKSAWFAGMAGSGVKHGFHAEKARLGPFLLSRTVSESHPRS
mgnify:CR=1 FL=1